MVLETIAITRLVDARGSVCPGPLMALIGAVREQTVGDVIAVYSTDTGSKKDIPLWVQKAGHELIGVYERGGYAEFVVRKRR
ncbi:MAG TPA: sulfurtransferase TusA family protein [Thermoplasmata archaeon]|nr:sulfurtransferase TusA family protein [Thermoplasmata archaeon]